MSKKCQADGCKNDVWSNLFCKWHQYLRTDEKWLKTVSKRQKRSVIKPISDKRKERLEKYEQGKKEKEKQLKGDNQWNCIFCGEPLEDNDFIDFHHLFGRDNDIVFDMRYVFPSHTYCHIVIYHGSSYSVLSSQRWYEEFLTRIKTIDIKLYNKEIRKGEKS
ncbi:MAG: hypothetical protein KAS32_22475 [Candidatus Peribacteraceae bacterium]|nr:hypothetical protein [Candidatus Peribacteraceae bacterium]